MADTDEAEGGGEADPLGRGFPLIQVCAEGERGGQKTDILQLPPRGSWLFEAPRFLFDILRHFLLKKNIFRFFCSCFFWPRTG